MRIIFFDKRSGKPITQLGNVLSPTWERFIPTVGTSRSTNGNIKKGLLWIIEQAFCFVVCFLSAVFEAAATNELTHDAGGWNLLIADGDKVMQEL